MNPATKLKRSAEQKAEEEAIRRQHAANPVRVVPAGAINQQSLGTILRLIVKFKAAREKQGIPLAEIATRMGIDVAALEGIEAGRMLNPTIATLCKWAEALGQKLEIDLMPA